MFSKAEKEKIATEIEKLLLSFNHPEMPTAKPSFRLHVDGKEDWSFADIEPNWKFEHNSPGVNPWNEVAREVVKEWWFAQYGPNPDLWVCYAEFPQGLFTGHPPGSPNRPEGSVVIRHVRELP